MSLLRQLAFQRRQQRASLLDLAALRRQRQARDGAQTVLRFDRLDLLFLRGENILRGLDLRAQLRLAYRGGHDVRCEGQPCALELVNLIVDERLQALELPALAAGT